jgi:hypothetical protein
MMQIPKPDALALGGSYIVVATKGIYGVGIAYAIDGHIAGYWCDKVLGVTSKGFQHHSPRIYFTSYLSARRMLRKGKGEVTVYKDVIRRNANDTRRAR